MMLYITPPYPSFFFQDDLVQTLIFLVQKTCSNITPKCSKGLLQYFSQHWIRLGS